MGTFCKFHFMTFSSIEPCQITVNFPSLGAYPAGRSSNLRDSFKSGVIVLRIINGKYIIFPKAIQKPRCKTRGDVGNVGGVWLYRATFA